MLSAFKPRTSGLGFQNLLHAAIVRLRWRDDLRQLLAVYEQLDFRGVENLAFDQGFGDPLEGFPVLRDDLLRGRITAVDQLAHFLVNLDGGVLAVITVLGDFTAQEYLLFL